jgi:hypothetical protein
MRLRKYFFFFSFLFLQLFIQQMFMESLLCARHWRHNEVYTEALASWTDIPQEANTTASWDMCHEESTVLR